MNIRNWLQLSRKLVDQYDMNYTSQAYQNVLGQYAHGFWGTGVLPTTFYPNPFPITLSGSIMQGTVGNGICFDDNGQLISIDTSSPTSKNFTIPAADPSLPRKDLICIRYTSTGDTLVPKPSDPITSVFLNLHDDFQLVVRPGTPSATPAYPSKDAGDVILGGLLVPAGATIGTGCTLDLSVRELARINFSQNPIIAQEVPSGLVNGTNVNFTLAQTPLNAGSLILFLDTIPLDKTLYSQTGMAITMGAAPAPGQELQAYYVVDSASSTNPLSGAQEIPTGIVDGTNDTFTLAGKPADQNSTLVWVNGEPQELTNWTLEQTGSAYKIKFNPGFIPQPAQQVYVFYFVNPASVGVAPVGGGSGAWSPQNTESAPLAVTAAGGVTAANVRRQLFYVKGPTSGGQTVVTANPQISAGFADGDEMQLIGLNSTDYPELNDGNGLKLNGPLNLKADQVATFTWSASGSVWRESSRR